MPLVPPLGQNISFLNANFCPDCPRDMSLVSKDAREQAVLLEF